MPARMRFWAYHPEQANITKSAAFPALRKIGPLSFPVLELGPAALFSRPRTREAMAQRKPRRPLSDRPIVPMAPISFL